MPELPEVEIVRRGLEPALVGRRIARVDLRRPDLRFPFPHDFAARLAGAAVDGVARRAKYLLIGLSTGETLIVHLGMSGRITLLPAGDGGPLPNSDILGAYVYDTGALPQHDHVVLGLSDGTGLVYNDPRRFGFMLLADSARLDAHPLLGKLGPEPLSTALDVQYLARAAAGRRCDLKAFLLDQHVVAGLGNIYVCEALFRAQLSPRRRAETLALRGGTPTERAVRLVPQIKAVLEAAIAAGGSSLRDYRHTDGEAGHFQERFAVYDRDGAPCLRPGCTGAVSRLVQANRSTFHCPRCQR